MHCTAMRNPLEGDSPGSAGPGADERSLADELSGGNRPRSNRKPTEPGGVHAAVAKATAPDEVEGEVGGARQSGYEQPLVFPQLVHL
jgi:hypothetical protein